MAAGEWIPWTKGLARKPEVLTIARKSGRSLREVSATLMEFWEWADDHTTDGQLSGLRLEDLGAICPHIDTYFFELLIEVQWLERTETGLRIPKFTRWMGNSSKRRLKEAKRKRRLRVYEIAAQTNGQNARHSTGQNRTGHSKQSLSPGSALGGDARGGETRSWAKGEFAAAVAGILKQPAGPTGTEQTPQDSAHLRWFPDACELAAAAFGYRRVDDPTVLAAWAPTFRDCTVAEFTDAVHAVAEAPADKQPKGRQDCRSRLRRRIVEARRAALAGTHTDTEGRALIEAQYARRRSPGLQSKGDALA